MMSPIQILGNMLFASGFRTIIDQTQAGFIYFGVTKSGNLKSQTRWTIVRCKITNSNKLHDFEWADGEGINNSKKVWNDRTGYTYQSD